MVNIAAILFVILCAIITAARCGRDFPAFAMWTYLIAAAANALVLGFAR